jgi:hypothetical protein
MLASVFVVSRFAGAASLRKSDRLGSTVFAVVDCLDESVRLLGCFAVGFGGFHSISISIS